MPNFRRGATAIEEAATAKGGGDFRPFVPEIMWKDDKEEKSVLFLTPVDEIPTILYHDWIPVGKGEKANGDTYTKYEKFISRKDPAIGETYDDLEDRLNVKPKLRQIAVAVELEPLTEEEEVRGRVREKVVGFQVATDTFTRKTDNGEVEVTAPKVGLVVQAAQNFFGWLSSYDASKGPIEETPLQIVRRGKKTDTTYDFIPVEDRPVDLSGLLDNLDGISYLGNAEEVEKIASDLPEDELEAALAVAAVLLDKRLEELADKERYDGLVKPIEHIEQKYASGGKAKSTTTKRERPARVARRAKPSVEAPAEDAPAAESEAPDETPASDRADRFAKLREKLNANS